MAGGEREGGRRGARGSTSSRCPVGPGLPGWHPDGALLSPWLCYCSGCGR